MKLREHIEAFLSLMACGAIACGGLALAISCSRPDASAALESSLRQARLARDSAAAREARVRDSAQQAVAESDAAWGLHVRDLVALHQQELQAATRAAARRARAEVRARAGSEDLFAEAPDTGSGRPPCEVTLTCSEAAAWQASDSLLRFRGDSARAQARVDAAACSSRVAEAVVHQDSTHAKTVFQQRRSLGAPFYALAGAAATLLAFVLWGAR